MRPGGLILLSWALGAPIANAQQAYNYGVNIEALTRRQDGASRVLVGRLPLRANGSVPVRPEIRQMMANPYKWDLFVLALSMFQYVSQNDSLSWYQVAGIHGVPFQTWNGVQPILGASQSGYCTHSSVLFPIWHRPYLALFEQELYRLTNIIASMFPDPNERQWYEQAASDFRLPYWDWAMGPPPGEAHFPEVFWNPTILQRGPNGVQYIRNPLYAYPFHPLDEDAFIWSPLKYWQETKRAPATNFSLAAPPSNNQQVNEALLSKLPEIQQRLYILFSNYKEFNSFSNKAWAISQNLTTIDSIESIHDIIHIYGGLKGHMTYVPLSAFDPLFLIHHVTTDRLIAMWQALNPSAWMTPMPAGETTYTTLKGTLEDANTPLTPFLISDRGNGTFWNSAMARTTEIFGYTYADTDPAAVGMQNLRRTLAQKITSWYGGFSPFAFKNRTSVENRHVHEAREVGNGASRFKDFKPNVKSDAQDPPASVIIKNGHYTEWIANVAVNVEALDGNFGIHFFIGQVPADGRTWDTISNHIGAVSIFAMDRMTGSQSKISGTLPLTSALMKMVAAGEIPHLAPEVVEPFLRATMHFRVLGSDDTEVNPELVDGLYIGVSSTQVKVPETDEELPKWGSSQVQFEMWA